MTRNTILAQPLVNGTPLPDFQLVGPHFEVVGPDNVRKSNGLVVAFIHATWCPYCVRQLMRLNRLEPTLANHEVGLVCISHDPAELIAAYGQSVQPPLRYPLLADSQPSIAHTFGIYDPDHDSPYPAVFYVGADNLIWYTDVSSDPDCFPNMERLQEVIHYGPAGEVPDKITP